MLLAAVEHRPHRSHNHFLPCCHVGRTAHDLHGLRIGCKPHRRDMQVVGVRVRHAGQHLAYNQTRQTTLDGLYFLYRTHLQTDGGQNLCHCLGIIRQRNIAL